MSLRGLFDDRRTANLGRAALVLAAAATVFGFAGALWWPFDLFAHFRPQYLLAALLLAAFFAFSRLPLWTAVALAVTAANAVPIVSLYLPSAQAEQPSAASPLRLMSFNVFAFNRDHERMLRHVRRELPDVLVLIEVTPEWVPAVRELAAQYPHRWINVGDAASGIAMMSREQPSAAATIDLAGRGAPSYLLTFGQGPTALSVLGTHFSWPLGRRVSEIRNAQLEALARLARAQPHPLVVMGDLNITPFSPRFTRMLREGGLRRCVPGAGFTPTWPAHFPPFYIQIDHCLASAGVYARNFKVGDYLGSDHYPISVEVSPADSGPPISRP